MISKHNGNPGMPLDLDWVMGAHINRSAVERRTATLPARRSIKREWQAAWLMRAVTCIDLTTLGGDDTPGRVRRLCAKAKQPVRPDMLAALGAISSLNSILPVQVLESAFQNLGTVISPMSDSRYGTPILKIRLEIEQGEEMRLEVKQGALVSLPLKPGHVARIHLEPLNRTEVDPRRKNGGSFKIVGGLCGAVIDARGRSLNLPEDAPRRRDMHKKWLSTLTS